MSHFNEAVFDLTTVIVMPEESVEHISSTMVRKLIYKDVHITNWKEYLYITTMEDIEDMIEKGW